VRGGNDQIPAALTAALKSQITLGSELVAIRQTSAGGYSLTFDQDSTTVTVAADRVVLALPFSMLRTVDYSRAGFGDVKTRAIRELPMGTNSKLHLGFKTRHWNTLGCNADTYGDTGFQSTWEVTRAQPGASGILVDYTGGRIGDSFGSGTPTTRAKQFLGQIEPMLPGLTKQWDGRATVDYWAAYPWTRGSYSYYAVGQWHAFGGAEPEISGACHFCGEHTTQDFQGYLNGATSTGERAASEVLSAI
jgi:monoamine oxidase